MTSTPQATPFRTAIVPAAGLGTRFLPATRSVAKELLPVGDTPGIELVATEAVAAGAHRLVLVISPGKEAVARYFQADTELERTLTERGKADAVAKIRRAPALLDEVVTAVQQEPLGLGHAVGCAESALDDDEDAVAVLLPDDLVLTGDQPGVLTTMAAVRAEHGGTVLCAFDVPRDKVSAYGVFAIEEAADVTVGGDDTDRDSTDRDSTDRDSTDRDSTDRDSTGAAQVRREVFRVTGMVEKPTVDEAPSTYAAVGRYLLDRAVFDALRRITPGAGGELQLTDAIALLIDSGHPVHVVVHRGLRHDIGNPAGYVRALVDTALTDPDDGPALREWLTKRVPL